MKRRHCCSRKAGGDRRTRLGELGAEEQVGPNRALPLTEERVQRPCGRMDAGTCAGWRKARWLVRSGAGEVGSGRIRQDLGTHLSRKEREA